MLMSKMTRYGRMLRAIASATYKEWAAYRTHSMVSILVGPIYYLVQYFIWNAVYNEGQTIGGLSLEAMLTYAGVTAVIGYLTMDFADWNLQMLIHTGKYLTFALRPIHHRYFAFCQKIGHRVLGFLFEFVPVFLIFALVFRVNMMPAQAPWAALSIGLAYLMNFYVNYCIGLTGFWLTKTGGLRGVIYLLKSFCSGALIPLTLFPDAVGRVLFLMPFQFMTYVPARVYTGTYELAGRAYSIPNIVAIQAIYVLLLIALSECLYRVGVKRFTGVGA